MQWSHSASTIEGETKIFAKLADDFRLLKADGIGGYIEMARGSYLEMRDLDERTYAESSQDFNRYAQERRNEQRGYDSNNEFYENRSNDELINGQIGRDVSEYNAEASNADSLQDNTRGNLIYSAKPSETAQRITENFGYTDATANNIVKAAHSLKQKADSKADLNELAYTIAQTLEDRRNGNTNGRDAERIAMMLAENAKAVNEDFVAEHKPILDRLNGMKISISEADISGLGDAFSYVKKRLFPIVTLAKEGGTPIDTVFNEPYKNYDFVYSESKAWSFKS